MKSVKTYLWLTAALAMCWCFGATAAENWQHFTTKEGLPGDEVQFLSEDDEGLIRIGTLTGLGAYGGGKFSVIISKGDFWDALRTGPDKLWVCTGEGVILFEKGKQQTGLAGSTVAPIVPFATNVVWAISKSRATEANALMENDGQGWKPVERFQKEKVVLLHRSRNGTVWVAVDGNGVFAINPKDGPAQAVHHLQGQNVTAIFDDSKGRVWCGLWGRGVMAYDGTAWTRHVEKEKSCILAIREDAGGRIWATTSAHGLWRYDGNAWANDLADEGAINMIEATSDGRVWISSQTKGGLRYWDGKAWQVSLESPLPIRCLIETKKKELWAGGVLDGVYVKR